MAECVWCPSRCWDVKHLSYSYRDLVAMGCSSGSPQSGSSGVAVWTDCWWKCSGVAAGSRSVRNVRNQSHFRNRCAARWVHSTPRTPRVRKKEQRCTSSSAHSQLYHVCMNWRLQLCNCCRPQIILQAEFARLIWPQWELSCFGHVQLGR